MKNINIFVYGSLREGFFNYNKYLDGKVSKKINAKLNNVELYHMPYKGYPAIINGQDSILGEIMIINEADYDSTLEAMDEMEGFLSDGNPENEYHKMIFEVENLESNEIESILLGILPMEQFIIKIKMNFLILKQFIFLMETGKNTWYIIE